MFINLKTDIKFLWVTLLKVYSVFILILRGQENIALKIINPKVDKWFFCFHLDRNINICLPRSPSIIQAWKPSTVLQQTKFLKIDIFPPRWPRPSPGRTTPPCTMCSLTTSTCSSCLSAPPNRSAMLSTSDSTSPRPYVPAPSKGTRARQALSTLTTTLSSWVQIRVERWANIFKIKSVKILKMYTVIMWNNQLMFGCKPSFPFKDNL